MVRAPLLLLMLCFTAAPANASPLQNGVPVSGLAGSAGTELRYTLDVPAGATNLIFQTSGGSGDADLYVRYGNPPTLGAYDCRPYAGGNNETCAMPSATAGTWHVMIRGYTAISGVTLVASYTTGGGGGGNQLQNGVPVSSLTGSTGTELRYTLDVPAGATNLIFQMSGGGGDADLYVRYGSAPTTGAYDCRPYAGGNNETCAMPSATAGTWHVMVRGYTAFSAVTLVASYTTGGGGNLPPTANAGTDQTVTEGVTVNLTGSGTDTDGFIASYAWVQIPAPTVTLSSANTANASFVAPAVTVATILTFQLTVTDNQGATGTDTVNINVNPVGGGGNQLQNGVPVSGLAGSTGTELRYTLDVPAGAANLVFQMSDGGGDADLYVRYGNPPTTGAYDCRPYAGGNNETCAMPSATAGTWHVMIRGYTAISGVTLVASYTTGGGGGGGTQLEPAVTESNIVGATGAELRYTLEVPAGAANLILQLTGDNGDADLYVRYGAAPTLTTYDCRPYVGGSNETCAMLSATAGTWHVLIHAYTGFSGASLTATYGIGGGFVLPPPVPSVAVCVSTQRENVVFGTLPIPAGASGSNLTFGIPLGQNGSKGTATVTNPGTGEFSYAPNGIDWGLDTFGYVVTDTISGDQFPALAAVVIGPRIMPLGDSITAGVITGETPAVSVRAGYRKPLYDALLAAGYPFDFVGSQNQGFGIANFDFDNEGHEGWSAFEIAYGRTGFSKLIDWLNAEKPDIILLHIGTNDFTTNTTDVAAILNYINLWATGASGNPAAVFLAQIINRNPYQSVDVLTYNLNLATLAANRDSAGVGPTTFLIDQESALVYPNDLLADPNGLHPDANGYARMANVWSTALMNSGVLPKCP